MPPPFLQPGVEVSTKTEVPARVCLGRGRGYRKVALPVGRYRVDEIWRDEKYWHVSEKSDGYTYRIHALERQNPMYSERISIWQNDLADAIYDQEDEEF